MAEGTETEQEEALLIILDGQGLDDAVYRDHDLTTLEDQLIELLEPDELGELDGHEFGPSTTTIYLYGPDAEKMFARVQPVLSSYLLCQNSRAIIRRGGPGSKERVVEFPFG